MNVLDIYDEGFKDGVNSCLVYMNTALGTNFKDFTDLTNFVDKHACIAIPGKDGN